MEVISNYTKCKQKGNIQKPVTFLYTDNEQAEHKMKKNHIYIEINKNILF